jgi:hypothetical protein
MLFSVTVETWTPGLGTWAGAAAAGAGLATISPGSRSFYGPAKVLNFFAGQQTEFFRQIDLLAVNNTERSFGGETETRKRPAHCSIICYNGIVLLSVENLKY